MIQLFMSRSGSSVIVPLNLPASHGAMTEAYSQLEQANRTGKTEIVEIKSVIANLPSYLGGLDPDSRTQLAQLNLLSSIIAKMDSRERSIYAGALDGNSINDLNDMIRVAEQVSDYILIPNLPPRGLCALALDRGWVHYGPPRRSHSIGEDSTENSLTSMFADNFNFRHKQIKRMRLLFYVPIQASEELIIRATVNFPQFN